MLIFADETFSKSFFTVNVKQYKVLYDNETTCESGKIDKSLVSDAEGFMKDMTVSYWWQLITDTV